MLSSHLVRRLLVVRDGDTLARFESLSPRPPPCAAQCAHPERCLANSTSTTLSHVPPLKPRTSIARDILPKTYLPKKMIFSTAWKLWSKEQEISVPTAPHIRNGSLFDHDANACSHFWNIQLFLGSTWWRYTYSFVSSFHHGVAINVNEMYNILPSGPLCSALGLSLLALHQVEVLSLAWDLTLCVKLLYC